MKPERTIRKPERTIRKPERTIRKPERTIRKPERTIRKPERKCVIIRVAVIKLVNIMVFLMLLFEFY